jgi:hypothetical protein
MYLLSILLEPFIRGRWPALLVAGLGSSGD